MSLFGLRNHTRAVKRLVLIFGVVISEERSLDWASGPRSDSATILRGSFFKLIEGLQCIRTEFLNLSRVDTLGNCYGSCSVHPRVLPASLTSTR